MNKENQLKKDTKDTSIPEKKSKSKLKSKSLKKIIIFVLVILFSCILCLCIIVAILLIKLNQATAPYDAKNSIEELEMFGKDSLINSLEVVNFENFSVKDPEKILDPIQSLDVTSKLIKLEKIALPEEFEKQELNDKTIDFSLDFNMKSDKTREFSYSNRDSIQDIKIDSNVKLKFQKDFDQELLFQVLFGSSIPQLVKKANLSKSELESIIPEIYINADFDIYTFYKYEYNYKNYNSSYYMPQSYDRTDEIDMKGNIEISIIDKNLYLKFSDLRVPEKVKNDRDIKNLLLIEDKVIKINFSKEYDRVVDEIIKSWNRDRKRWEVKDFDNLIQESIKKMPEKDEKFIKAFGNEIKGIIIKAIKNTNLFNNIKSIDPIRESSNAICHESDVDFESISENSSKAMQSITEVIEDNYEFINQRSKEYSLKNLNKTIEDLEKIKDLRQDDKINASIRLCSNVSQSQLQGIGLSLFLDNGNINSYTKKDINDFSFDLLLIDLDSPEDIEVPDYDVDMTKEIFRY